jgi:integrase
MGLDDVTPHDLRRTAASGMTSLGINRLTVSKILNHVETGVTAVYDRHGYDAEKRHALEVWATRLEEIITGKPATSNVVSLATAGDAQ